MSKRSALDVADLAALGGAGVEVNEEGVLVRRGANRNARNSGQFGVAMHYVFEPLDTEFGAYFMNYHSRDPILSASAAPQSAYNAAAGAGGLAPMIGRLGDGVHQVKVAQASGMESPSLVRLLDQLCSGGYVCRTEDIHDRRAKALSLTERGRELVHAVEVQLVRLRKEVLADIAPDDMAAALRVLRAFEAATL